MRPAAAAAPPAQPKAGPGGAEYAVAEVAKRAYGEGSGQAFVLAPSAPATQPRPVVVFLHGWGVVNPRFYGAWLEHLARSGHIVVYPRYQESEGRTMTRAITAEAAKGVKAALTALGPSADLSRVAYLGHGAGATIAANLAAAAEEADLPRPRLVMGVMAVRAPTDGKTRGVPLSDLSTLDAKTLLVMVTGDRDTVAGEGGARQIIRAAGSALAPEQRLLVKLPSDNHGQPALVAGHHAAGAPSEAYDLARIEGAVPPAQPPQPKPQGKAAPLDKAAREQARKDVTEQWFLNRMEQTELQMMGLQAVDAMDWYGLWKTFDLAREAAFAGRDALALKRDPRLFDMGLWSDGWPMRRLSVESPRPEQPKPAAGEAAATVDVKPATGKR